MLAFVSLYNLLGWSAFVGVGIMIFSIPLNTVIKFLEKSPSEADEVQGQAFALHE